MGKYLAVLAFVSAIAFVFPSAFERYRQHLARQDAAEGVGPAPAVVKVAQPVPSPAGSGRAVELRAGPDGHFRAEARLNGRPVDVLVDTGATYVSMNEATARRLGIFLRPDAFRHKAQTANGETAVATAKLDRVRIGGVEVRDVDAIVSRGDGLGTTLLGMSFLGKLERFEIRAGRLSLVE